MKILQLIPGAGNTFYCENCLRDNGLAINLRKMGHDVVITPLYLPILTDDNKADTSVPVFFGGINVYLQQKLKFFRNTPRWVDKFFDSNFFLKIAANMAGMTRSEDLAETTLSMLRGEHGHQKKEYDRLEEWLLEQKDIDVIHISNALLSGFAPGIKEKLNCKVVCTLQDEDIFVNPLDEHYRKKIWNQIKENSESIDAFIAVSNYEKSIMCELIGIPEQKVHVIYNAINLVGIQPADDFPELPTIGFLERQCEPKGLHVLVEAFIRLKKRNTVPNAILRIAGGMTADDKKYINNLVKQLKKNGFWDDVEILPNLTRMEKIEFLHSLSVMSVPAVHKEAFGIYLLEALGAGIPVVQPSHGSFPELLKITEGGLLYNPENIEELVDDLEELLLNNDKAKEFGLKGRENTLEHFKVERMAAEFARLLEKL